MSILPVIDLHSHIVPGVDDGARNFEESAKILDNMEQSYTDGSIVVFTPHYSVNMPAKLTAGRNRRVTEYIKYLSDKYSYNIISAGELLLRGLSQRNLEQARYPGTGWVLVEFSSRVGWLKTLLCIRRIIRKGYSPLIAHPERYHWCRRKNSRLVVLSRMGCGALLSARSLKNRRCAPVARKLLEAGLVHGIASDTHSPDDYILDSRLRSLVEKYSCISWNRLTFENPRIILEDEMLPALPLHGRDTP